MIWRASSAVATFRPNCSAVFAAHSTCRTDSQRFQFMSQMLSSFPTRACAPRMVARVWIAMLLRMLLQNVTELDPCGGGAAEHLHPVEWVAPHRTVELVNVARHEVGLDLVLAQSLQMLDVE